MFVFLVCFGLFCVCVVRARHMRATLVTDAGVCNATLLTTGAAQQISRIDSKGVSEPHTRPTLWRCRHRGRRREGGRGEGSKTRLRSRPPLNRSGMRHFYLQPLKQRELCPFLCGKGLACLPVSPGEDCPCHTMKWQLLEAASAGNALNRFQNPDPSRRCRECWSSPCLVPG